jgi:phospholipid/cholesterol/gamma-HCH transport system permease protein
MSQPTRMRSTSRISRTARNWADGWNQIGDQTGFYLKTIAQTSVALGKYRRETLRCIAEMSLGIGALAFIGGTVVIVTFLTANTGVLVAVLGYTNLNDIGVAALEGVFSAFANPRLAVPAEVAVGLAATIGAGTTAQLGAMRISEEIDALEVMGIRAIAYLASTRMLAGLIIVMPLGCLALIGGFVTTRVLVLISYGQALGVYDHYFNTFLKATDLLWCLLQILAQAFVIMLIHTYYGFNASGGPAGVGEATGRATRASLVAAMTITLVVGLVLYGRSGNFNLSG